MLRWPHMVGVAIGVAAGSFLLGLTGSGVRVPPESGPILSECDGGLKELVIHYDPSAKQIALPVYRQLLAALEPDVMVSVVCRDLAAYQDLLSGVDSAKCGLRPMVVRHPITVWSRDRWVALMPSTKGGLTTLYSPRGETAEEIWPARAGDERVGRDIAMAMPSSIVARRSSLYFDGGDFLADSENVFVIPRVLSRNLQHTVASRQELLETLSSELKRRVILLEEAPDHHAGMFMASAGNRTMLVGDSTWGKALCGDGQAAQEIGALPGFPDGADFSAETQRLFDAVASRCQAEGYKVVRIPTVVAPDARTYFTYVNALIDQRGERRIVYLPEYRGVERMNLAAQQVWKELGYEVRVIDCTSAYRHFGCLHCLVNVFKRKECAPERTVAYAASDTRKRTVR